MSDTETREDDPSKKENEEYRPATPEEVGGEIKEDTVLRYVPEVGAVVAVVEGEESPETPPAEEPTEEPKEEPPEDQPAA